MLHLLILFCFLTTILFNTAIINTDGIGVPLFYLNFPVYFFYFLKYKFSVRIPKNLLLLTLVLLCLICIPVLLQFYISRSDVGENNLKQVIAMTMLISNGFLLFLILWHKRYKITASKINTRLLSLLIFSALYGIYTFVAQYFHLPLFLNSLRNSVSFMNFNALQQYSGWSGTFRAFAVWAEPSFAAIPLVLLFLFENVLLRFGKARRAAVNLLLVVFAALTFSRVVFVVIAAIVFLYPFLRRVKQLAATSAFIVLFIIVFGSFATVVSPYLFSDLSAYGRGSSVIIGVRIFLDHIFVGAGFNTYPMIEASYREGLSLYHPENVVHNLFLTYAYQLGIIGLLFSIIPLFFPLFLVAAYRVSTSRDVQLSAIIYLFSSAIIGTLGGNVYYFGIFWMFYYYIIFLILKDKEEAYESADADKERRP